MGTLSLTKNYEDTTVLNASDFSTFLDELETFVNGTLNDDNIQTDGIDGSTDITDGSITSAKIADANITTAKIADEAITAAKVTDANVTTAKIADSNVTTAKIAASAVTTAKIANDAVTRAKSSPNYVLGSSSGSGTTFGLDSTICSATITTTGRPVMIVVIPAAGATTAYLDGASDVRIQRTTSERRIFKVPLITTSSGTGVKAMPTNLVFDQPAAGTYTYSLVNPRSTTVTAYNVRLYVREL